MMKGCFALPAHVHSWLRLESLQISLCAASSHSPVLGKFLTVPSPRRASAKSSCQGTHKHATIVSFLKSLTSTGLTAIGPA